MSGAFSTHDAADGHAQSWSERVSDAAFGAMGLAGTTAGLGKMAIAAANVVDDIGRWINILTTEWVCAAADWRIAFVLMPRSLTSLAPSHRPRTSGTCTRRLLL